MTSRFAVGVAAVACVALAPSAAPAQGKGDQAAGRYGWVSSLKEGKDLAAKNGKPLMVVVRCVP